MLDDMYKLFLDSIPWPLWIAQVDGTVLYLNKAYEKIYKIYIKDAYKKKYEQIVSEEVSVQYYEALNMCVAKRNVYRTVQQIDGKHLECTLFPIINKDEQINFVSGIIMDISDRKEREQELESQKDILRTIIDALPQWIFYKDKDSRFIGYNKRFAKYYEERGIYDLIGKTDLDIYADQETARQFMAYDQEIMQKKEAKYFEQVITEDGVTKIEENVKIPVLGRNGEVRGIVGVSCDITEKKSLEEKLRYLSEIDSLTGLYNRHSFEEKLKHYSQDQYLPLGIIMGDVNGLKLVNDTLGHLEGDKFLKDVATVLKDTCKDKGDVFRWGGDEFIILIPQCTEDRCEQIIEEINHACDAYEKHFIQMNIALGSSVKHTKDEDAYDAIRKIEDTVYRRKLLEKKSMKSSVLETLKKSLEEKNMETNEHATRVIHLALELGRLLGFRQAELDELALVAQLHDIGKIAIPEEILLKPGKLTEEEFEIIKTHAEKGYRILIACGELNNVAKNVLTHHEWWDGTGYPLKLKGEEIPLIARVVSIVDAYDVMTNDRVYKKGMSKEQAIRELKQYSEKQFDPRILEIFIKQVLEKEI